ncbi:Syntaxin-42 [Citrus sinensis]|uniref:Syntaxin-42 n=1 Tax=Citrus sinensis TaxID=2711 RepID=A0ACB8MLH9_CITSI|nr:Syntaxin-42 [Citrus sinensis]KAH9786631.1 Syntaxin-42 [Citrus sinensis]
MIEILTYEITDLLRGSEKRLDKLSAAGSSEDSNLRKNVQHSLATDLQNHSMDLRKNHSTYLKHLQQQKEGCDGVDLEMNFNEDKYRLEDDGFSDGIHIEHLQLQAERTQKKGGLARCARVLLIMCVIVLVLLILKELFL